MSGYFTRNIAKESKTPAIVSLSGNPNYLEFASLNDPALNRRINVSLEVLDTSVDISKTKISVTEYVSNIQIFLSGTRERNRVSSSTFYVHEDKAVTAENIRDCLMRYMFFRSNYKVTTPFVNNITSLNNGAIIFFQSLGAGVNYAFSFSDLDSSFIRLSGNPLLTDNNDSIDGGRSDTDIRIEMYKNTGIFLGQDDTPISYNTFGDYMAQLSKAYYGSPLWFDLNALIGNNKVYSDAFLTTDTWCDSGTLTDYRIVAKQTDGVNIEPFYISNVLYALTGYTRNLNVNNLADYVYNSRDNNIVKPLTHLLQRTHIRGQKQYFNFILADPNRIAGYNIGMMYKLYTQSRRLIDTVVLDEQLNTRFSIVNTISLRLDDLTQQYDNVGYIEACLCRSGEQISEAVGFTVLPECLYKVNEFAFLNALGGWDSFNFGGVQATEFETEVTTIYKTQTPDHTISSEIEAVYSRQVSEQFTATSSPIRREVVDWLKELSAAIVVYELSTKRVVIVDEMNLNPNSNDDLFTVEMKYRYSDAYNAMVV